MSGSGLVFVKLGGSLITDKSGHEAVRRQTLKRLASELEGVAESGRGALVIGHGSGSFGHAVATETGWSGALDRPSLEAVARTQDAAARLHRFVIEALLEVGLAPFSITPGSLAVSSGGDVAHLGIGPLVEALRQGLLPVLRGDVVLDSQNRARIFSTERVFEAVVPRLIARGFETRNVCWLGTTNGILNEDGETVARITRSNAASVVERLTSGAALTPAESDKVRDVTGGMRHRLESALALGRLGVPSWILDGTVPGRLERAVAGESVPGTYVEAGLPPEFSSLG